MQIILLENIEGLGRKGDQVKVREGYGRNHLLPYRKALLATPDVLSRLDGDEEEVRGRGGEDRLRPEGGRRQARGAHPPADDARHARRPPLRLGQPALPRHGAEGQGARRRRARHPDQGADQVGRHLSGRDPPPRRRQGRDHRRRRSGRRSRRRRRGGRAGHRVETAAPTAAAAPPADAAPTAGA